jgi:hypothetical protein
MMRSDFQSVVNTVAGSLEPTAPATADTPTPPTTPTPETEDASEHPPEVAPPVETARLEGDEPS